MKSKGSACLEISGDARGESSILRGDAGPSALESIRLFFLVLPYGVAYAAFSDIVLFAIGRGAASTRYAVLSSFGNIPVIYMTSFDGWARNRFGPAGMLWMEALAGIVCVFLGLVAAGWMRKRPATR